MAEPSAITREGILDPDGVTVHLNGKLPLPPGPIRLIVYPPPPPRSGEGIIEVLDRIHREQRERGRRPPTEEETEAQIAAMRADDEEYEERMRAIWAQTQLRPEEPR